MAENMGLIEEVGQQVLEIALTDFKEFLCYDPDFKISVNISNRQLFSKQFIPNLTQTLSKYEINTTQIKPEITESITAIGINSAKECLNTLTSTGLCISLDDFGTGYSSLSYLHKLPIYELKIDLSFVRRIKTKEGFVMVKTIVDMGHAMEKTLVAEGVEDAETAQILNDFGVDYLLGYYFRKPIQKYQMIELIQKFRSS